MAIENYAKSLISDARSRNKQQGKDELKGALGLAFGKLLGKGIKSGIETNLESKKNKFLQNEELLTSKIKYKTAVNNGASFIEDQSKINDSGKSAAEWFYEQMEPTFKQRALQELPIEISGEERLFDQTIHSSLMPEAQKRANQHEQGLLLAQQLDTFENFNTSVDAKIKKIMPESLMDAAVGSATRLFSGKTKAEQEMEVLKAIQTGKMSKSAEAMIAFNERYKETKNVLASYTYATVVAAEDIQKIADEELDIVTETKEERKVVGDRLMKIVTTTVTNKLQNTANSTQTAELDTSFDDPEDKVAMAKAMMSTVNLATDPRAALTPDAYSNYVKEVTGAKLNPMDIRSPKQFAKVATIYAKYTAHKPNLKDDFKDDIFVAVISKLSTDSLGLNELFASLETHEPNSPEHARIMDLIESEKKTWWKTAGAIADYGNAKARAGTTAPPLVITNVHNIPTATWSTLTSKRQQQLNSLTLTQLKAAGII